ncbi:MAG: flagellar hook-length control protein FliK [Succinivibrionaceae bacterium]|nr:flagellar hook-length control protein FliK [Succinivibrionaceae bacterium]
MQIASESTVTGIAGKVGEMYRARNSEQTDFSAILNSVNRSISETAKGSVKKTSISGTTNGRTAPEKNSTRAESRNADAKKRNTEQPRSEDSKASVTRNERRSEGVKTSGTEQKKNASVEKDRRDVSESSVDEVTEAVQEGTGMTVGRSADSDPEIRIAEISLQRSDISVNESVSVFESQLADITIAGVSEASGSAEEALAAVDVQTETDNSAEPVIRPELYTAEALENEADSEQAEPVSEFMAFLDASRSANPLVKSVDQMTSASAVTANNGSAVILQDNTQTTVATQSSTELEESIAQTLQLNEGDQVSDASSSETDVSSWSGRAYAAADAATTVAASAGETLSDPVLNRNRMKLLNAEPKPDVMNTATVAVMSEDALVEPDTVENSIGRMSFLDGLKELNRAAAATVRSDPGNISAASGMSGSSPNVQSSLNPGMNFAAQMQSVAAGTSAEISAARDSVEQEISGGSNTGGSVGLASDKSLFSEKLQELTEIQKPVHMSRNYEENARQIAEKINIMLARNLKEAEMNLDPTGLGKMKISLQMSEEGVVRINMIVQQGETKDLVYESMNRLREVMQQGGITLGESSVEHQESWAQNSQNGETSRANDQTFGRINGSEHEDSINVSVKVSDRAVDYFA